MNAVVIDGLTMRLLVDGVRYIELTIVLVAIVRMLVDTVETTVIMPVELFSPSDVPLVVSVPLSIINPLPLPEPLPLTAVLLAKVHTH